MHTESIHTEETSESSGKKDALQELADATNELVPQVVLFNQFVAAVACKDALTTAKCNIQGQVDLVSLRP